MPYERRRRSWAQRLVLSLNVLLVLALLTLAAVLVRYNDEVGRINRISGRGTLTAVEQSMDPFNVLLVGVDNAEGLDPNDPVLRGRYEASLLSDTIMVVRVDPQANRAWLLSIPRDLYIPIAGTGGSDKINSALALGGPQRLIDTLQQSLGIPINHYVQVNFSGFSELTKEVGGVPVWFEYPARDENTGLNVETTGCVVLEGEQALAFVRSRYYEAYIDGQWVSDPTSDRGRIARQQAFVRAALNRAVNRGARNPFELQRMIEAAQGEVVLDDNLSIKKLLDLGERFRDFNPDSLEIVTLPGDGGWAGAASVIYLREAEAQPLLAIFRGQSVLATPTALVRVEVRNGSGRTGQAVTAAADLRAAGFTVVGTGDAPFNIERTTIAYAPGQLVSAWLLARFLGPDKVQVVETSEDLGDVGVVLTTGSDWSGLLPVPVDPQVFTDLMRQYAETQAQATATTEPGGLTMDDLGNTGTVPVPSITTTTVTPREFVPTPPEGQACA